VAIMRVVEPYPAAEYNGTNSAEMIECANAAGVAHSVQSQAGGVLVLTGDGSTFTLNTGDVLIGRFGGWGMVLPRVAFDAMFREV
jgi:hypothetical protein